MSSLPWLPPLNSHNTYTVNVTFCPFKTGPGIRRLTNCFLMNVHAVVEFTSSQNKKPFSGLHLNYTYYFPCHIITSPSFSSSETNAILDSVFSRMLLPFELDHIVFQHRNPNQSQKLSGLQDLASVIQSIISSNVNSGIKPDLLSFRMDVVKSVVIPHDEYEAWNSWYNEKRNIDPNFVTKYMCAIFNTRTDEELLQENQALTYKKRAKISTDTMKIHSCDSSKNCLICLEELPPQTDATILPCNHVFHQGCIIKWLEERDTCPSCRFLISST